MTRPRLREDQEHFALISRLTKRELRRCLKFAKNHRRNKQNRTNRLEHRATKVSKGRGAEAASRHPGRHKSPKLGKR